MENKDNSNRGKMCGLLFRDISYFISIKHGKNVLQIIHRKYTDNKFMIIFSHKVLTSHPENVQ